MSKYTVRKDYENGLTLSGGFDTEENLEKFLNFLDNYDKDESPEKKSQWYEIIHIMEGEKGRTLRKFNNIDELLNCIEELTDTLDAVIISVKKR